MFLFRLTVLAVMATGLKLRLLLLPKPSPVRFQPFPAALQRYNCWPVETTPVLISISDWAMQVAGNVDDTCTGIVLVAALASTDPVKVLVPAILCVVLRSTKFCVFDPVP